MAAQAALKAAEASAAGDGAADAEAAQTDVIESAALVAAAPDDIGERRTAAVARDPVVSMPVQGQAVSPAAQTQVPQLYCHAQTHVCCLRTRVKVFSKLTHVHGRLSACSLVAVSPRHC